MTTKVRIIHEGGSHPVNVYLDGTIQITLEKAGDAISADIYGRHALVVREHRAEDDEERAPSHDPDAPHTNGPDPTE